MKTYVTVIFLGIGLLSAPLTSFAALDWRIQWDGANSPHTAEVYIFNPEDTFQSFTIEIGDVARAADAGPDAPYLIIGQDISILRIAPSERKIFKIIVYHDIDPEATLKTAAEGRVSPLSSAKHAQELRALSQKYGKAETREYPFAIESIQPVPREEIADSRFIYKSKRGYWLLTLVDHDHIAEQIIRTGERMRAQFDSIQQAIFYYTQTNVRLTDEAQKVWDTAFPELRTGAAPTPPTDDSDCVRFVTVVTSNLSYYAANRALTVGDILAANNPALSPVAAAVDVTINVSTTTAAARQILRVYLMSQRGQPSEQSEYVSLVSHSSQIEQVIRIGTAEGEHPCAIQDVIFYLNNEVPALTTGLSLWNRLNGPPVPPEGRQALCLRSPTVQPTGRQAAGMTFLNLAVLVGAVVPVSLLFRRKGRK